ncbi:unnamed protein product [Paramecium pentaurelia]|uniref:Transmembrane protein n=1 Tax=Paramecium pentaurelia TaxID=43138 RepID=A0A8S1VZM5_9CILI|nr:unnamed protein product [Paramecium pentaurelia]
MNTKLQNKTNKKISFVDSAGSPKQSKQNTNNQIDSQKEISSEFIIRQKVYENLYKYPEFKSEKSLNLSERGETRSSKFRTIIDDAKSKYLNSNLQSNKYYIEKQQSSMKLIADQFRNQKKLQNKGNLKQTQTPKKIKLNLILSLAIPILCIIVIIFELLKQDLIIF